MSVHETPHQAWQIMITERVSSCFSLLGIAFIFITFFTYPGFQKPINRLLVCASFGNLCSNIATLISNDGNKAGPDTALCQTQGFSVQMFMPADALWTLCMAINVYLTFYHDYDTRQLRALEWKYFLACYGIPFIPALTFCFIKVAPKGIFMARLWLVMIAIFAIYMLVGNAIFKKQHRLRATSNRGGRQPAITNPFTIGAATMTTEIKITSEPRKEGEDPTLEECIMRGQSTNTYQRYTINIESEGNGLVPETALDEQRLITESYDAAKAYAWCSFLFFLALIVTWVPSGIGRVYYVAYPDQFIFGLHWITAFTLPLQGFWNGLIYIATSLPACRAIFRSASGRMPPRRPRLSYRTLDVPDKQGQSEIGVGRT